VAHEPAHTIPLSEGPAAACAIFMAADGHPRLAAGLLVQQWTGMRPSEMLGLHFEDVLLPEETLLSVSGIFGSIGLGVRRGTKAKRAQSVLLRGQRKLAVLRWLKKNCSPGEKLVPYTYEQYRRILAKACKTAKLPLVFTPHGPRAGFATDLLCQGVPFGTIKDLGRWLSDSSLRTYLDVVGASSIAVTLRMQNRSEMIADALQIVLDFLPGSKQWVRVADDATDKDAAAGLEARQGFGCVSASGATVAGEQWTVAVADINNAAQQSEASGRGRGWNSSREDQQERDHRHQPRNLGKSRGKRGRQ